MNHPSPELPPLAPVTQSGSSAILPVGGKEGEDEIWLALTIGNSRVHWGWFIGDRLQASWDTPHLIAPTVEQLIQAHFAAHLWSELGAPPIPLPQLTKPPVLWIASVVPSQLELWQNYPLARVITLKDLPLLRVYPTLGIDRALAVLGAGTQLGWPVLVIDAGTALTFTGSDDKRQLVGGAILPGLGLQLKSLAEKTAALPALERPAHLPARWALDTVGAIHSGIIYTLLAGVRDFIEEWWHQFPGSPVTITGGDATLLLSYLQTQAPTVAAKAIAAPHLILWGIRAVAN